MADNEINISVQTQQQNINATPNVQQSNIDVNYTFDNVLWGRILGNINNQADLITLFGTKQDTVSDLGTIRSGAALGSTAVQPADLATVATTGDYEDLLNKPTIPTDTEDLTNGAGYQTASDVSSAITSGITGKANTSLNNLTNGLSNTICTTAATTTSTASAATPAVVVENYVNGTSWYRVWSDGWCEQGGYIASTANDTIYYLLKQMRDTNYMMNITAIVNNWSGGLNSIYDLTTSSFKVWTSDDGTFNPCPLKWEVKGYIATGN